MSCIRNNIRYTEKLKNLAEELEYELPIQESITMKQALTNVCEAWKAKRIIEKEDGERRAKWLDEICREIARETGSDADKVYKRMIQCALSKGVFKRLKSILKREWSALDYIEVPNEIWYLDKNGDELYEFDNGIFVAHSKFEENLYETYGSIKVPPKDVVVVEVEISDDVIHVKNPESIQQWTWTKVTKPEEMEEWLMRRNKRHLQQMYIEQSPPTTEEFDPILADHGTSSITDEILNGTVDLDRFDLSKEMKLLLRSLQQTPEEKEMHIPGRMPREAFQEVMKIQNENTSSSPSALHYTLWKAIAEVDDLAEIHALWVSIPFMYGFICERHKREIDCMLEKKPGVRQIHIMRIIGLMEACWNAYLKWAYNKHVMPNAEKSGLSSNQWGGRRGRGAIACAMRKLMTWEYFRFVKETVLAFPGDLQSNFDRMIPSFNSIISMKYGMTRNAARCRAATVEAFERNIRTAAGTSERAYRHEDGEIKLGGEIQGKPDNMQLWAMESSILLKLHEDHCHGVELKDPSGTMSSKRTGDAYVDDKDTWASAPETNTIEEGVENIQTNAQFWAILITLVGQAFAFHKCFWQGLCWMALGGYYVIKTRDKFEDLEVWIRDHRGKATKIKYRHHDKPNDGLGLRLCPTANQKPEYEKRLEQTKTLTSKIKGTSFKIGEAWTALKVCVLPAVTYPFALTRFTKRQLGRLNTLVEEAFLPKLGINRKMSRKVLRAPIELGGIALPNMQTIQDQKGIVNVMRQLQLGKENATDFRILLAQAQLDSGLVHPILDKTDTDISYIEPGMIVHLHERLEALDGSIVIENQWCPRLQRIHDESIMEKISKLPDVRLREIQHVNQCRKWMRVITIAELSSICGRHIEPTRFNGRWRANSRLRWPRQPAPTAPMWDTFRRLIKRAFCSRSMNRSKNQNIPLDKPLGSWYNVDRHVEYDAYRTQNIICKRPQEEGPSIYERYEMEGEANYFTRKGDRYKLPYKSHPISMTEGREGHFHSDNQYDIVEYPNDDQYETTEEEEMEIPPTNVLQESEELIACSDGSYDPIEQKAAFNWRIVTPMERGLTTRSAPVNTNPKYLNSYRAEFAGLRGVIRYMRKNDLHRKKITLYCDGQSCVDALNSRNDFTAASLERAESDIIQATQKMMKDFKDLTIEWIKGHQDDDDETNIEDRPLPVRLNIQCDLAAKECLKNCTKPTKRAPPLEGAKATLYLGTHMVTTEMSEQIHYAAEAPAMMKHIQDHLRRTSETVQEINWRIIGRAKRRLKLHESIRIMKMMYGWLNIGTQKQKMGQIEVCPCCGEETETQHHLYTCTNETMQQTLKDSIAAAKTKLVKQSIPSDIYNEFIEQICLATRVEHPDNTYTANRNRMNEIREQQSRLGEEAFLKGFLHIEWTKALNEVWTPPDTDSEGKKVHKKDPMEQSVCLLRALWDIFEAQWACRNDILHGKRRNRKRHREKNKQID